MTDQEASVSTSISPSLDGFTFDLESRTFIAKLAPRQVTLRSRFNGSCAVLQSPDSIISREWIEVIVHNWQTLDDVFVPAFLSNIIFILPQGNETAPQIGQDCQQLFDLWRSRISFATADNPADISAGPYYVHNGAIYAVMRAFVDTNEAFITATHPQNEASGSYRPLAHGNGRQLVIGIPSRLYTQPTEDQPLKGLRISIKDNIDLAGTKKTLGSRAWEKLDPPCETTSMAVQRLLDLGAYVVGKTKLSQFGEVEHPTADWVDFHCPFNPRGDGYLNPEGSSTGGAVTLASYDWLDVSIGTDSWGSIREPASRQGLFTLRPTWGALSVAGVFPLAPALDTIGVMCRDVNVLHKVTSAWLSDKRTDAEISVTKIIVPCDFDYQPGPAKEVFDKCLSDLEHATPTRVTRINLGKRWLEKDPSGDGKDISEYIGKQQTTETIKAPDLLQNTRQFRSDYRENFGSEPYVNPAIRMKCTEAKDVTAENQKLALERKKIFKNWFTNDILYTENPGQLNTVAIWPISNEEPEYRDNYSDGPRKGSSKFHAKLISALTGCPEVVVPIGQVPYHSRVTDRQEYLPIVVGILGDLGTDVALTKFVADVLNKSGMPTSVRTGRLAFEI